jgi:hypothetical protein
MIKKILLLLVFLYLQSYSQSIFGTHTILFTTSKDGLNWEKDPITLIENGFSPSALFYEGKIYLYYISDSLSLITSNDTAKSFHRQSVKLFRVSSNKIVDPCIKYYNNSFKLFFITSDSIENKLHVAYSNDGQNFFEDSRIIYSEKGIFKPDVVIINNKPIIYLTSGGDLIRIITHNGKHFFKDSTFYFPSGIYSSSIIENNFIRTYYTGDYSINSFRLENGKIKKENNVYKDQNIFISEPSVIKISDSLYYMFYKKILPNNYIDTCGCVKKLIFE